MSTIEVDRIKAQQTIECQGLKANQIEILHGTCSAANIDFLNVSEVSSRYGKEIVLRLDGHGSRDSVDISNSGISDLDFIKILRSKLLVYVNKDDPQYIAACAHIVVE